MAAWIPVTARLAVELNVCIVTCVTLAPTTIDASLGTDERFAKPLRYRPGLPRAMRGPVMLGSVLLGVLEQLTRVPSNDPEGDVPLANASRQATEGLLRVSIPTLEVEGAMRGKSWARLVRRCPRDAQSGFDIEGDYTLPGALVDLPPGAVVLVAAYRHPGDAGVPTVSAYRLEPSGDWAHLCGCSGRQWAREIRNPLADALSAPRAGTHGRAAAIAESTLLA